MGNCSSAKQPDIVAAKDEHEGHLIVNGVVMQQSKIQTKINIPIEIQVSHFTPPTFPLSPIISKRTSKLCMDSWQYIVTSKEVDETGFTTSGITMFYQEFYSRLALLDSRGQFEAILTRHASSDNKVAVKGAILVRIVKFVVAISEDTPANQMTLFMLGKSHTQRHIRPWQYSTFIQVLLNTMSSQLGTKATNEVMEAWVNLFAFVMQSMLPPAINGLVVETELNINTSSEFDGGAVADQIKAVELLKVQNKTNFSKKMISSHHMSSRLNALSSRISCSSGNSLSQRSEKVNLPPIVNQ